MAIFQRSDELTHPIDFLLAQRGWLTFYHKEETLLNDISQLKQKDYTVQEFDCSAWEDVKTGLVEVGDSLDFPDYYGKNFDALNECLLDMEIKRSGLVVVFRNFDSLSKKQAETLLDIFANASRYQMLFGCRLFVLAQVNDPKYTEKLISEKAKMSNWNGAEWFIKDHYDGV